MNENYIAYETLVANRAAAEWACWAMIASWVSAGATIVTLFWRSRHYLRGGNKRKQK